MRINVCNRRTNNQGWNIPTFNQLWNNYRVMFRYYKRTGEFPSYLGPWKYRRRIAWAIITGWEFRHLAFALNRDTFVKPYTREERTRAETPLCKQIVNKLNRA